MNKINIEKKNLNVIIVGAVIVLIFSFYIGNKVGKNSASAISNQNQSLVGGQQRFGTMMGGVGFGGGNGGARNRMGGAGGGFVNGEIISKDDKSITVKLRDGGSKIVFLSGTTEITKSITGASSDLEIGKNTIISGKQNSDGSVTAETIQIRPQVPFTQNQPSASATAQ